MNPIAPPDSPLVRLPRLAEVRSISRFGLSAVTVAGSFSGACRSARTELSPMDTRSRRNTRVTVSIRPDDSSTSMN